MSFDALLIHTVTVFQLVHDDTDRYGNEVQVPDAGTDYPARVEQESGTEDILDRDTRITRFLAFLGPAAVIDGLSVVAWGDRSFRVVGEPEAVYDGIGLHHYEITLEEVLAG